MDTATEIFTPNSFDELIFKRELNEVHLLLDFISGRPHLQFGTMNLKFPKPSGTGDETLGTYEAITYVCKLKYPPDPGSNRAADAALVILVKDMLSAIAYPARGVTIAYTYSFIEPTGSLAFTGGGESGGEAERLKRQTRTSVAREAYPGLYESARRFRRTHEFMTYGSIALTFLAAFILWMVTYGVLITSRFEDDRKQLMEAAKKIYDQVTVEKSVAQPVRQAQPVPLPLDRCKAQYISDQSTEISLLCNNWSYLQARYEKTISDACTFATHYPSRFLMIWFPSEVGVESRLCRNPGGTKPEAADAGSPQSASVPSATQEDIQSVTLVLSIYSNYVLPIVFGLLGTAASMLRSIGDKIRDCVLAPRDAVLAFLRMPLGLMAGVAVGLFFSPTSVAKEISSGMGVLTITASGIAFLAGYGADGFFRLVDRLINHLFGLGENGDEKRRYVTGVTGIAPSLPEKVQG